MQHFCADIDTPFGPALAVCDGEALSGFYFVGQKYFPEDAGQWERRPRHPVFLQLAKELKRYGSGAQRHFDVPIAFSAGTEFQRAVWHAIAAIPFGATISYRELAERVGKPTGVRAAAAATGRNPISLIVPCHRVVGSNGALTGYAGGLDRKRALLDHERGG